MILRPGGSVYSVADPGIGGFTAPGYERVAEEFERNFVERGELGAAFSAVVGGECVVDLWGGRTDRGPSAQAWRDETLQLIFSGTKGLVALCLLMLIDRGQLCLDAPVARYWPEFGANGKQAITVGELVSHRARLPAVQTTLTETDLTDDRRLAAILAQQAPERDARAKFMYHPLTFGWMCSELIRRIDGRSVGRFFAEEAASPLELELWIGLPAAFEPRVSTLVLGPDWGASPLFDQDALTKDELMRRVWANPAIVGAGRMTWNTRAFHAAEVPGANAIGTARSLARVYGCLACDGELNGVRLARPETIVLGRRELSRFVDPTSGEPAAFAAGFELQTERRRLGPPVDAFGHTGAGGSVHAAWPDQRVGVSYVMNEMRDDPRGDPRSESLLNALFEAVR